MTFQFNTKKAAKEFSGNVSLGNTKMPGTTVSMDAFSCKVGSKLAKVKGSVCHKCYARRIQKMRPSVDKGWKANQAKLEAAIANGTIELWAHGIAYQITKAGQSHNRFLDAGDLVSVDGLQAFVLVAKLTPSVLHWVPTREAMIVKAWLKAHPEGFPANMIVRVSATKVNDAPRKFANTSTVHKNATPEGHICPASTQGNKCGDCRACWDHDVANVSYPLH